jgi:hypothetical protein
VHALLIEVGAQRHARLLRRYAHLPFVTVIQASAVPLSAFPDAAQVTRAHAEWSDAEFPLSDALKWLQEDVAYVQAAGMQHDGLGTALAAAAALRLTDGGDGGGGLSGDALDVAVLDGSEFTGWEELSRVYGARVIALDDTRTLKHRRSSAFLRASRCYAAAADRRSDRNGWAIFERVPGSSCLPFP